MHADVLPVGSLSSRVTARVGKRYMLNRHGKVDGRSRPAKRQKALELLYARQMGGRLTKFQQMQITRTAALGALAETVQQALLVGSDRWSPDDAMRITNAWRRAEHDLLGLGDRHSRTKRKPVEANGHGGGQGNIPSYAECVTLAKSAPSAPPAPKAEAKPAEPAKSPEKKRKRFPMN
jgi:hypothetical protein